MKKQILTVVVSLVIILAIIIFLVSRMDSTIKVETAKIKKRLGTSVVIENDTLLIVDYSMGRGSYTLSDGKEISWYLVEKIETVK